MSRAPPILDQPTSLDEIANQAAPPSAAPGPGDPVYQLLVELRRDVEALRHEQAESQPPPPGLPPHERQLYAALNELKHDIESLKKEQLRQAPPQQPGEGDLDRMLGGPRDDIAALQDTQPPAPDPAVTQASAASLEPAAGTKSGSPFLWAFEIAFLIFVLLYAMGRI